MTTDNLVSNTAKSFAALLLGVLFVFAFTLVNCAWAEIVHEHRGNETDWDSLVFDYAYDTDPEGPTGWPGGITPIDPLYIRDVDDIEEFNSGEEYECAAFQFNPDNAVTFTSSLNNEIGENLYFETGRVIFGEGATCTIPTMVFVWSDDSENGYTTDSGYDYDSDNYNFEKYASGIRSFAGEFNVDKLSVIFGSNFSIDGDITLNSLNNDNIRLVIDQPGLYEDIGFSNYKLKVPVLSNSTLTLNKPLVAYDTSDDEEGKGQLKFMPSADVTLKVCCEAENSITAESVFISSGRVDIKGVLESDLEVESGATFSPGNSIETTTVAGSFILDEGAILLLEIGGQSIDANDQLFADSATYMDGSVIKVVLDPSAEKPEYGQEYLVNIPNVSDIDWDKVIFSSDTFYVAGVSDEGYLRLGVVVPEPSTWALLILGAAGLLYLRKKNA